MTDIKDEELGPIDYLVIEFPPGTVTFTGELARELTSLVEAEIIRVLDVMVLQKDADGNLEVYEFEDLDDLGDLGVLEGQLAEILAEADVADIAAIMEPGSVAGVLVWENRWAAPFAVAARKMGGQLIANDRIHTQALLASLQAVMDEEAETLSEGA